FHAVVLGGNRLGKQNLFFDRIADPVLDELDVVGAIGIYGWLARICCSTMAAIRARSYIASIGRCGHCQIACAPAATYAFCAAVPGRDEPASTAICGVQRQPNANVDVLVSVRSKKDVYLAIGFRDPRPDRYNCARHGLDLGITREPKGRV